MNLILTSDFPATPNDHIVARFQAASQTPRIAWIPPFTDDGASFATARVQFAALGLTDIECVDVDEDRDDVQIAFLHEFDVVFLSDGDAVRFRFNAARAGLSGRLRQCVAAGRLVVGSGGGALLLTPNVSLVRLRNESLDEVFASRGRFDALGAVPYEVMPHANGLDPLLLEKVAEYSARVEHDVLALDDGSAIFPTGAGAFDHIGAIARYRHGKIVERLS